ncbi:MAG: tyrosine-protein phosphatase [Gemmatimonadales bacterium]
MIDLHSHLLPGVDDGSRSVEQSVAVLREMARHGITDICLTPHLLASMAERGMPAPYDAAFDTLIRQAPASPRLHPGAEVMLDQPLDPVVGRDRRVTLGGTGYILVEFPRMVPAPAVIGGLESVCAAGLVPVLAHPERYVCCTVDRVREWKALGALMQVDASTLLADRKRGTRARDLVAEGLADILAADNHGDGRLISTTCQVMAQRGGELQADLLGRLNPERILRNEPIIPVPPFPMRGSWWDRLRASLG